MIKIEPNTCRRCHEPMFIYEGQSLDPQGYAVHVTCPASMAGRSRTYLEWMQGDQELFGTFEAQRQTFQELEGAFARPEPFEPKSWQERYCERYTEKLRKQAMDARVPELLHHFDEPPHAWFVRRNLATSFTPWIHDNPVVRVTNEGDDSILWSGTLNELRAILQDHLKS